ncbi:MAG: hypothetical protein E7372_04640 [Clostridiales bacterium]|nr:hypothetical protein [Clostridiales bacterium]
MEEIKNEQISPKTQTAEAEISKGEDKGEVSLGKFKDVGALLSAYNSLQSEFTKRCQKIKELESKIEGDKTEQNNSALSNQKSQPQNQVDTTLIDKEKFLKEYLLDVLGKKPSAIIMDGAGVGVKTPVNRPTTIEEAGKLAKKLLNN